MLTSIFFSIISIRKGKRFVSKQGQPQPHIHSKAVILSCKMAYYKMIVLVFDLSTHHVRLQAGFPHTWANSN